MRNLINANKIIKKHLIISILLILIAFQGCNSPSDFISIEESDLTKYSHIKENILPFLPDETLELTEVRNGVGNQNSILKQKVDSIYLDSNFNNEIIFFEDHSMLVKIKVIYSVNTYYHFLFFPSNYNSKINCLVFAPNAYEIGNKKLKNGWHYLIYEEGH